MLFGCVRTQLSAFGFQLITVRELDVSMSWSVLIFIVRPLNPDVANGRIYFRCKRPPSATG
jgi:hypothetical protein